MAAELTRKELYDLVWSVPMRQLATRYGISDSGLAKICRKANIPIPGRGYWAKRTAGKRVVQSLLPRRGFGMPEEVSIGHHHRYRQVTEEELLGPVAPPITFDEDLDAVRARVVAQIKRVTVPRDLSRAHPVVAHLLQEDELRRQKQAKSAYALWDAPLFDSADARRRLRVMNALFLAVSQVWARPSVSGKGAERCYVQVGHEHVGFAIQLIAARARRSEPSKRARLEILLQQHDGSDVTGRWTDEEGAPIERKLQEIAIELIVDGERRYRQGIERAYQWRLERKQALEAEIRRKEEERIRLERERREKLQKERLDKLLSQAIALENAGRIRAYVDRVLAVDHGAGADQAQAWATWARSEADRIDPIRANSFLTEIP